MTPVSVQDLPGHWPFVKAGLEEIIAKTGEQWTPTHMLAALNQQQAFLFVCEDGFAILEPTRKPWTAESWTNVWALWFKPNTARARRTELFAWVDQVVGSKRWGFSSPLKGWTYLEGEEIEIERITWRRRGG